LELNHKLKFLVKEIKIVKFHKKAIRSKIMERRIVTIFCV